MTFSSFDPVSEIEITDLSHDGRGVGKVYEHNHRAVRPGSGLKKKKSIGKTCFIRGALPGERVRWKKTQSKRSFDEGHVVELIQSSDQRVLPRCEYYEHCGGCQLQHLAPFSQVAWKQDQLKRTMERDGLEPKFWLPALTRDSWHYRRRTRLAVNYGKKGQVAIGYRKKRSNTLVEIRRCEILDESLNSLFPLLWSVAPLLRHTGVTEFELTRADNVIAICVNVKKTVNAVLQKQILEKVLTFANDVPIQFWQKRHDETAVPMAVFDRGNLPALLSSITDKTQMHFVPGQFIQVNGAMNQAMIAQSLELTKPDRETRVLDLFCGAGNFSLAFAEYAKQVTGVEGLEVLCQQAAENAREQGYCNTEFQVADLTKTETLAQLKTQRFDLLLLDPPRAGALNLVPWIRELAPEKILYISCHPATMVRDIALLKEDYQIDSIGVMDMFPHTAHLEAMLLLTRKTSEKNKSN